jgi:hypothetical protein
MRGGTVLDELVEVAPGYYLGNSPLRACPLAGGRVLRLLRTRATPRAW